jgi:hypothetical protein
VHKPAKTNHGLICLIGREEPEMDIALARLRSAVHLAADQAAMLIV